MSKHTPGPWVHDTRGYRHADVKAADGRNIACTWGVNNQPKTKDACEAQKQIARANARLIAAAPELLEALKAIVKSLADQDDEGMIEHAQQMIDARAAIAKATGGAA